MPAKLAEDDRVDPVESADAVLEVLRPGPRLERAPKIGVGVAEPVEAFAKLLGELLVDVDPLALRRLAEIEVVEAEKPLELVDRRRVVVDPQVDEHVGEARVAAALPDDEERRRLLAAPVAAGGLRSGEAGDQAVG